MFFSLLLMLAGLVGAFNLEGYFSSFNREGNTVFRDEQTTSRTVPIPSGSTPVAGPALRLATAPLKIDYFATSVAGGFGLSMNVAMAVDFSTPAAT